MIHVPYTNAIVVLLGVFLSICNVNAQTFRSLDVAPARDGDAFLFVTQSQAFKHCIDQNPVQDRAAIARALRYQLINNQYVFNPAIPAGNVPAGAVYLPTIRDLARTIPNGRDSDGRPRLVNTGYAGVPTSHPLVRQEIETMWESQGSDRTAIYTTGLNGSPMFVDFYYRNAGLRTIVQQIRQFNLVKEPVIWSSSYSQATASRAEVYVLESTGVISVSDSPSDRNMVRCIR